MLLPLGREAHCRKSCNCSVTQGDFPDGGKTQRDCWQLESARLFEIVEGIDRDFRRPIRIVEDFEAFRFGSGALVQQKPCSKASPSRRVLETLPLRAAVRLWRSRLSGSGRGVALAGIGDVRTGRERASSVLASSSRPSARVSPLNRSGWRNTPKQPRRLTPRPTQNRRGQKDVPPRGNSPASVEMPCSRRHC